MAKKMTHRLFLTMSEDEFDKFEGMREQLGMNRSMYVRYLLAGQKELRPPTIRYSKLVDQLNSIDRSLKVLAMKDSLTEVDRILIVEKLGEITELVNKHYGSGQIDSK